LDGARLHALLSDLLAQCAAERLIPRAGYRFRVQREDGYGIGGFRCVIEVWLDPYARARLVDPVSAGLIPWNRAVVRDGRPHQLIGVEVRRPAAVAPSTS
jgi:hypothetical protein